MARDRIQQQWRILSGGTRTASVEGLDLWTTNDRVDRWGPVKWWVLLEGTDTVVASGDTWQSPDYASLVRQAMLEAERAAAEYLSRQEVAL